MTRRVTEWQTPTLTVRLKVEGCRVKNGECRIKSEELSVGGQGGGSIINLLYSAILSFW